VDTLQIPVGEETFDARVAGPPDGEVVLLHGFPQTSWSWRSQLAALGAAGSRAVAPDQRGYSVGARTAEVERYSIPSLGPEAARCTAECVQGPYRFEVFEGVGHWIAESEPERLNALLLEHPGAA
jgi:pimeloyl-ACP methyl ester carboxylesterase